MRNLLGGNVAALLHEGADSEPHGVAEGELVDQDLGLVIAGVGVVPLVGAEPGEDEQEDGHPEVGRGGVDPHVQGQWGEEGEQVRRLLLGLLVEDADPEVHEGHGEVHGLLPLVGDGQVGDGEVRLLGQQLPHQPVPLPRLLVHEPVSPVIHPFEGEIELWKEMGSEKVLSCESRLTQYLSYLGHKINRKSLKSIIPREPLLRLSDHAVRLGLKVKVF